MVRKSSIYDHFDLYLTPVTLTFNLPDKMFQMALLLHEDNNCAKLFWNPCKNVQVMARTSSMYDHFDLWLLWPLPSTYLKNVSNSTSRPQEQQLCQIFLQSMHKCTSYGPDRSGRMHGHTHIHWTKIVTTMSRLPASWLDKNCLKWLSSKGRNSLIIKFSYIKKSTCAHLHYVHNKYARFQKDPLKTVGGVDYTNSIP